VKKHIPSQEETVAQIGYLLLMTQDVEHTIVTLIGTAYPNGKPTWEEISKLNKETLGTLISKLKKRVEMPDKFVGLLEMFLEGRNIFVHRLREQSWFDLHSENGRNEIWNFIETYQKYLTEILYIVQAALFREMENKGMPETEYHKQLERSGYLREIKSYYPKSQFAFRGKKAR
jgi:hypothetical protein